MVLKQIGWGITYNSILFDFDIGKIVVTDMEIPLQQ